MTHQETKSDVCCPEFDPATLDSKTHEWKDKLFLQDSVRQFFHIPFGMGKVITRMWKQVEEAGANPDPKDWLLLCYDPSPWKSELHMSVSKEVPGGKMVKLTGTFLSKVFDGPYNSIPKHLKVMEEYVKSQGKQPMKHYIHYTYCPKCAKKFGHNYIVFFTQVE